MVLLPYSREDSFVAEIGNFINVCFMVCNSLSPFCLLTFDWFLGAVNICKYTIHGWYGINRNLCKILFSQDHTSTRTTIPNLSQVTPSDLLVCQMKVTQALKTSWGIPLALCSLGAQSYDIIWSIYNKSQMFSQVPFQVYQGHSLSIWNQKSNHFHDKKNMFFSWKQKVVLFFKPSLFLFDQRNSTPHSLFDGTAWQNRLGKIVNNDRLLCKQNLHTVHCSSAEGHKSRWEFAGVRWFPNFRHFQWEPPMDLQEDPPTRAAAAWNHRQVNLTWLAGLTSAATVGIIGGALCL